MTSLADVISRLEKAEGPERQLDAYIYKALGHEVKRHSSGFQGLSTSEFSYAEAEEWLSVPRLTGSIDAAVALAERVFEAYHLELAIDPPSSSVRAKVFWWPLGRERSEILTIRTEVFGKKLALTICIAVLKALQEGRS